MLDDLRQPADITYDHWALASQSLDGHHSKSLVQTRDNDHPSPLEVTRHFLSCEPLRRAYKLDLPLWDLETNAEPVKMRPKISVA